MTSQVFAQVLNTVMSSSDTLRKDQVSVGANH